MAGKWKNFFWTGAVFFLVAVPFSVSAQSSTGGGWNPDELRIFALPEASVGGIIFNLMRWLLFMTGFVSVASFAISGIFYLTSAGEQTQIDRAKRAMNYSMIGTIVAISGLVAINFFYNLLSGSEWL